MTFRFLHVADVHLDTPFQSRDQDFRSMLQDSLRKAFESCIDLALSRDVHAVLIAGDLFDSGTLSFTSEKLITQQMERLNEAGIKVFYAPGNHDPLKSHSRAAHINWPSNVHVFNSNIPLKVPVLDETGRVMAFIIGAGHEGAREAKNLAEGFPFAEGGTPHIGLLHTYVTGLSCSSGYDRYAPCTILDLAGKGYNYWALGHIHAREEIHKDPYIIYPGSLMGRDPSETGQKGAYLVKIKDGAGITAEFVPISPLVWETVNINNLICADSIASLENIICSHILKLIEEEEKQKQMLLRVRLSGRCPKYLELRDEYNIRELEESIKASLGLKHLEIDAEGVVRPVDVGTFKEQPHVLGTALSIIDMLKEDDSLLLKLSPGEVAGIEAGRGQDEKIKYLRSLIEDMDFEAAACLLREDC